MDPRILLIASFVLIHAARNKHNDNDDVFQGSCLATNGALMDRPSLRKTAMASCNHYNEACFAFVPNLDTTTIELGCAPKAVLPKNCFEKTFTCSEVSPFLHNDKTGFLCCCRSSDCNNPDKISNLLPTPSHHIHPRAVEYKWWHFPILVFCSFAVVMLFGVIASVLIILKNITRIVTCNKDIDLQMYSRIKQKTADQLQANRDIVIANVDIAIQELYHFLVHRRLVFVNNFPKKRRQKPPAQHVVIKMTLRTLDELESRVAEQPHLNINSPCVSKNESTQKT